MSSGARVRGIVVSTLSEKTTLRHFRAFLAFLIAAIIPLGLSAQQSSADSLAITRAVSSALLLELQSDGDHRGPAYLRAGDAPSTVWLASVVTVLRSEARGMLADSATAHGLHFTLHAVSVTANTIRVTGSFAKCLATESHLNSWQHSVVFELKKVDGQWQPSRAGIQMFADGHCAANER